jgi:hypothetical protein
MLSLVFLALTLLTYFPDFANLESRPEESFESNSNLVAQERQPLMKNQSTARNPSAVQGYHADARRDNKPSEASQAAIVALVFLIFYPLLITACTLLPTWWNGFTFDTIQTYMSEKPSQSEGTYLYWKIREAVYAKLFPDIMMFYGFIYAIVAVALAATRYPSIRKMLLSRPVYLGTYSVAQVCEALAYPRCMLNSLPLPALNMTTSFVGREKMT